MQSLYAHANARSEGTPSCKLLQVQRAGSDSVKILTVSAAQLHDIRKPSDYSTSTVSHSPRPEPNNSSRPALGRSGLSLVLTKELIDVGRVELVLEWLESLSSSAASVSRYRDSLRITITGFDEPTPALNPRCRAFFKSLAGRWPYWLHFIEKDHESIGLLLMLLADDEPLGAGPALTRDALSATMARLLSDADRLYAALGVPEPVAQANCDAATSAYFEFVEPIVSGRAAAG